MRPGIVGRYSAPGRKLHEVARSCANVLAVRETPHGAPIAHVNEHIRIWGTIWERGYEVEIDVPEDDGASEE
ncbi:MAG: hypothetical protein ABSC21_21125 [Terriglobia bacterium]